MAYTLIIGEKNYSSWSLRAWLLMRHLGLPFEEVTVNLYVPNSRSVVRRMGGETGIVPVLKDGDFAIWDTLAIFETLHERHGGVWPRDARHRIRARSWAGEIHSGFNALRSAMPVNTRARGVAAERTPEVEEDIARAVKIWGNGRPRTRAVAVWRILRRRRHVRAGGDALPDLWGRARRKIESLSRPHAWPPADGRVAGPGGGRNTVIPRWER